MITKRLTILVGPPGSGKSTLALHYAEKGGVVYVNQDTQGKGHRDVFLQALIDGHSVIVDRMNFNRQQRSFFLEEARKAGYSTHISVLHVPRKVCYDRAVARLDHPTIKDGSAANSALNTFFSKYERPLPGEADVIDFIYPQGHKPKCVVFDLDGTLCNIDHRLHTVQPPEEWKAEIELAKKENRKNIHGWKPDWKSFFEELSNDEPNAWCAETASVFYNMHSVIYASGRPDDYKRKTEEWLQKNNLDFHQGLYMRCRGDHRHDFIAKEIILDFEILTRWTPVMFVDDRQQVIDLWRRRGFTALQCAKGDF